MRCPRWESRSRCSLFPGPGLYDSVAHGLTTAATGGFSPYANSIGHFDSLLVELVVIAGMLFGAVNFALHWRAAHGDPGAYARDSELRTFVSMIVGAAAVVVAVLWLSEPLGGGEALRAGVFNVISMGTSTGFGNAMGAGSAGDFAQWAPAAQMVILMLFVVGASAGSTSGGIKVMRARVLAGHMMRSMKHTQQPRAVFAVKHGGVAVSEDLVSRVAGFFLFYVLLICFGAVALTMLGGDLDTSIGTIISVLGNMGPALGEAGPTSSYAEAFSQPARFAARRVHVDRAFGDLSGAVDVRSALPRRPCRSARLRERPWNARGLSIVHALTPVVLRSCSLRSRAARATAPFGRGRMRDQSARPPIQALMLRPARSRQCALRRTGRGRCGTQWRVRAQVRYH